jgi:alpha-tubulin suppressor-like RCC1 family protein
LDFGSETNWRQIAQNRTSVVLLKSDGTLWRWGSLTNVWHQWPGLRTFTPYQIGTNADWQELFTLGRIFARRTDRRVWQLDVDWKTGRDKLIRETNYDEIVSQTASRAGDQLTAFVRADGTLWVLNRYWDDKSRQTKGAGVLQVGKENDWRAGAVNFGRIVALKSDGSLWQWQFGGQWDISQEQLISAAHASPVRLGIHKDWVALANRWEDVIAIAADGSLWLWPDREQYEQSTLLKLPKQPQPLGNLFGKAD